MLTWSSQVNQVISIAMIIDTYGNKLWQKDVGKIKVLNKICYSWSRILSRSMHHE